MTNYLSAAFYESTTSILFVFVIYPSVVSSFYRPRIMLCLKDSSNSVLAIWIIWLAVE